MDIYQSTVAYLSNTPIFDSWHEMKIILRRAAALRPRDWQLPVIACQAVRAFPEKAIPASAALACAQISIILVDDMLDDDPVENTAVLETAEPRTLPSLSRLQAWTRSSIARPVLPSDWKR